LKTDHREDEFEDTKGAIKIEEEQTTQRPKYKRSNGQNIHIKQDDFT